MFDPTLRATALFKQLIKTAGDGPHELTVSTIVDDLPGAVTVSVLSQDGRIMADPERLSLGVATLAVALAGSNGGCVLLRSIDTTSRAARYTVCGWHLFAGTASALSAQDVRTASCTGPDGSDAPPEAGAEYIDAQPINL